MILSKWIQNIVNVIFVKEKPNEKRALNEQERDEFFQGFNLSSPTRINKNIYFFQLYCLFPKPASQLSRQVQTI